jgi:hypothetical protein
MSGLPFPNLKLTNMPPRAKYEQNDLFYHAYTFVEFLQMLIAGTHKILISRANMSSKCIE